MPSVMFGSRLLQRTMMRQGSYLVTFTMPPDKSPREIQVVKQHDHAQHQYFEDVALDFHHRTIRRFHDVLARGGSRLRIWHLAPAWAVGDRACGFVPGRSPFLVDCQPLLFQVAWQTGSHWLDCDAGYYGYHQ